MIEKIQKFLAKFSDQNLANLQAAAEDGKLVYFDRCGCLVFHQNRNYDFTKRLGPHAELAQEAEREFWELPWATNPELRTRNTLEQDDEARNRLILPLIQSEWERRAGERMAEPLEAVCAGLLSA